MEASAGLVAGSHNRNELVVIRRDGESGPRPLQQLSGQVFQICGDDVGLTVDGDLFVACNECAFPICRTCYEYERREGNQVCPQCKTRFKRLKGTPIKHNCTFQLNIIEKEISALAFFVMEKLAAFISASCRYSHKGLEF